MLTKTLPWLKCYAQYMVEYARCCVSWAGETCWNYYWELVTERKMTEKWPEFEKSHSDFPTRPHFVKLVKVIMNTFKWRVPSYPLYSPSVVSFDYPSLWSINYILFGHAAPVSWQKSSGKMLSFFTAEFGSWPKDRKKRWLSVNSNSNGMFFFFDHEIHTYFWGKNSRTFLYTQSMYVSDGTIHRWYTNETSSVLSIFPFISHQQWLYFDTVHQFERFGY